MQGESHTHKVDLSYALLVWQASELPFLMSESPSSPSHLSTEVFSPCQDHGSLWIVLLQSHLSNPTLPSYRNSQ